MKGGKGGGRGLTTLCQYDLHDLLVAQTTRALDLDIPISLQRPANAQEEEYRRRGEEHQEADQAVKCELEFPSIDDAQQEEADGDLGQGEGDEGLDPV